MIPGRGNANRDVHRHQNQDVKVKLYQPIFNPINRDNIHSIIGSFFIPWNNIRPGNVSMIKFYITSRRTRVHRYHCFVFLQLHTKYIFITLGLTKVLSLLDLMETSISKYISRFRIQRNYAPTAGTLWNKKDADKLTSHHFPVYEQYIQCDQFAYEIRSGAFKHIIRNVITSTLNLL